eukprot:TRINITY_DN12259_c0_g2_i1.p1 TRINITY_DN12259_c0_g2~~TRINITY_DN12259_c0_g2_i1.p1  ORF type:complete len:100 (+),score=6.59 TRINITY_DN12259_c0_g2_i1:146-445(+)
MVYHGDSFFVRMKRLYYLKDEKKGKKTIISHCFLGQTFLSTPPFKLPVIVYLAKSRENLNLLIYPIFSIFLSSLSPNLFIQFVCAVIAFWMQDGFRGFS